MSSRFGADKALALWQGVPLALSVAEQVRAAAGSVVLVGSPAKYAHLGLQVIADSVSGAGPLAGLTAALQHTKAESNLVVACDMPYVTSEFLSFLLAAASRRDPDILLPVDRKFRPQPLCAVYARRCRPAIDSALTKGLRKMTDAFETLRVLRMPHAEYGSYDRRGLLFANLNTPEDLEAALPAG